MKTPLDTIANYVLLMIWALIIFYLSSEGSDVSSERSGAIVEVVRAAGAGVSSDALSFLTRKAAHIAAYFILGILVYRVVDIYKLKKSMGILLSTILVAVYATSDEIHQLFVPGRSGEVRDIFIDTSAGLVGVVVTYFIIKKYTGHKQATTGKISKNRV